MGQIFKFCAKPFPRSVSKRAAGARATKKLAFSRMMVRCHFTTFIRLAYYINENTIKVLENHTHVMFSLLSLAACRLAQSKYTEYS